ncbi:hypothetical protein H257_07733 [Aphanomyces astaci]|uniref:FYVE-type domain-containing protein n=1 Tax=Aphanomyces astaci TaxID=112090 RepID=W4GIT0_APHAT|nr:hypothetical protein H257_07733 [Aphanomyces astaci]ETV78944.1 hypothetical protein H257_07733 [Aphanomyces astaci]|eukprot:XP_009831663.1 hypothetical protein H257_07733 [Aphanomyces astaci]
MAVTNIRRTSLFQLSMRGAFCDVYELRFLPPTEAAELAHQNGRFPVGKPRLTSTSSTSSIFDVPWKPNASSRLCSVCTDAFGVFRRRRHHCRLCGNLVCNACSYARSFVRKPSLGSYAKLERTCTTCSSTLRQLMDIGDSRVKLTVSAIPLFHRSKSAPVKGSANPSTSNASISASATAEPTEPSPSSSVYIVSSAWYSGHLAKDKACIGPISNHTLVSFFEGKLRPNPTVRSQDYSFVDEREWLSLVKTYGGGPTITTALPSSKWIISFPSHQLKHQEHAHLVSSYADTVTSVAIEAKSSDLPPAVPSPHVRARRAAAAFAEAASAARREAESMATRKSMASVADFEELRQSLSSRHSMY